MATLSVDETHCASSATASKAKQSRLSRSRRPLVWLDRFPWLAMTESLETEPMGRIPTAGPYDGAGISFTPMACSSAAPTLALPSPSCAIPRNSRWTNSQTELRHGLKKAAFTLSPRARPIRAAVPPLSSSTAMHGPPEGTTASDNGSALAAICVTLPSGAMKTISSGM